MSSIWHSDLLRDMAEQVRGGCRDDHVDDWIARADELDDDVNRAWALLEEAGERGRLNPRRAVPERMHAAESFASILNRLAQAVAETRSMAHTVRVARVPPPDWDPSFIDPWLELLHRSGMAVGQADVSELKAARAELTALANRLPVDRLNDDLWPVYGALLVNLRNVLDALDVVAEAQPVQVPSPSLAG